MDLGHDNKRHSCAKQDDTLFLTEDISSGKQQTCLDGSDRELATQTNMATLTFVTNSERDAQGFRIFYTEGINDVHFIQIDMFVCVLRYVIKYVYICCI